MRTSALKIVASFFFASVLATAAWGQSGGTLQANPAVGTSPQAASPYGYGAYPAGGQPSRLPPGVGAINYVEGQASINGQALSERSAGSLALEKDGVLETQAGRVEMLLTPGIYLRLAGNSSLRMISPSLVPTEVELTHGRAMVEVDYINKNNDVRVDENGTSTQLLKKGLYEFDANTDQVRVFKGQAVVYSGDRKTTLGQGHEAILSAGAKPKKKGFKEARYEDDFYKWTRLRSADILQANNELAATYGAEYAPAWSWDPWFDGWAFPYYWGAGFYSPFWGYGGYGFYPYGFGGIRPGYRPGFYGRGFAGGFHGGGFHGGGFGGGFHGGGFGGGHGR